MSRLVVLLTTPRLPAGLLTGAAWRTLHAADVIAAQDPSAALVQAVSAEDLTVEIRPDATAADLLRLADHGQVVWLAATHSDETLSRALADEVVRRADGGRAGPEIEFLVGSYDPTGSRLLDLVEVMDRLRRECPWDQQQTHASLVRYLLEETYETIEAIEGGDLVHLREELGDLLLQVMFHARIASEHPDDPFTIDDVAGQIVDKLVRRHPHVFADVEVTGADQVETNWETIKSAEKSRGSAMEGIPIGLPALSLAEKVITRTLKAAGVPTVPVPAEATYTAESLGEVLFALVAAAQPAGIDPEQALRQRVAQEMADMRAAEQRAR